MENKTQDVYIPVETKAPFAIYKKMAIKSVYVCNAEKYSGMIVLTKEQFEKAIADAKSEGQESIPVKRAEDMDYLFDKKEKI